MSDKAILFNTTRCIACRGCQVACKQWNETDEVIPTEQNSVRSVNRGSYENPPDLSPKTWMTIKFIEKPQGDSIEWFFNRRSCMHCTEAACVEVCPSGALYHNEDGFVTYDKDKCTGCGYCEQYCPFDVPRLDTNIVTGVGKMDKCTLCTTPSLNRLSAGEEPACVNTCPTHALVFGDRDELISEAKTLVTGLQTTGSRVYPKATLYGEQELGGLHVLYVLTDSPGVYGLPENPQFPIAATLQRDVFRPLTKVVWLMVAGGLALNVLIAWFRQRQLSEENSHGND
ncbi:MAG: 4Fe-4S dicluster domain-containing protein [Dehalococcoidales bacterium]|nr:MAG: 4Fe-4S dicluster domain-containing protein [Dehalococcoidales bacterium]